MNIPDIDLEPPTPKALHCKDCSYWQRVKVYKSTSKEEEIYNFGWCPIQEDYVYNFEECEEFEQWN